MKIKLNAIKAAMGTAVFVCAATLSANSFAQAAHPVLSSDQIKAQYNADMKKCDGLNGNDQDICAKKAKAARTTAEADAKYGKETAQAKHKNLKEKQEADYSVAKEKCAALSGDAQDKCEADAKSQYRK